MNMANKSGMIVGFLGLTLLVGSLSLAGQSPLSDAAAQTIWGGGCACTGSATCSQSDCSSACESQSGGSYSVCKSSTSGTCATKDVQCGTKGYCDNGEGDCDVGGTDCSCHSSNNTVSGC